MHFAAPSTRSITNGPTTRRANATVDLPLMSFSPGAPLRRLPTLASTPQRPKTLIGQLGATLADPDPPTWSLTTPAVSSARPLWACCIPLPTMRFGTFPTSILPPANSDESSGWTLSSSPYRLHPSKNSPHLQPYRVTAASPFLGFALTPSARPRICGSLGVAANRESHRLPRRAGAHRGSSESSVHRRSSDRLRTGGLHVVECLCRSSDTDPPLVGCN